MPKRLLSSLTWKAGVAAAAFALVAGTGGATIAFANASNDKPAVTTPNEHANDTAGDHAGDSTDKADDDSSTTVDANTDTTEHPDNFGATVSEDAKDGGVDGHEIRDLAPGAQHRSDKATAAHAANADNAGADDATDGQEKADDANDDHAVDGQEKADDANGDHGAPDTATDGTDD